MLNPDNQRRNEIIVADIAIIACLFVLLIIGTDIIAELYINWKG